MDLKSYLSEKGAASRLAIAIGVAPAPSVNGEPDSDRCQPSAARLSSGPPKAPCAAKTSAPTSIGPTCAERIKSRLMRYPKFLSPVVLLPTSLAPGRSVTAREIFYRGGEVADGDSMAPVFRGASPLRSEEIVHESQFRAATDRHGKQAGNTVVTHRCRQCGVHKSAYRCRRQPNGRWVCHDRLGVRIDESYRDGG